MKSQLVIACVATSGAAVVLAVAALLSVPHFVERELNDREVEIVEEIAPTISKILADIGLPTTPAPRRFVDVINLVERVYDSMDE